MTPEQQARVSIDALLNQAGWHVCHMSDGVEAEVNANLKRAQALRTSALAKAFHSGIGNV